MVPAEGSGTSRRWGYEGSLGEADGALEICDESGVSRVREREVAQIGEGVGWDGPRETGGVGGGDSAHSVC